MALLVSPFEEDRRLLGEIFAEHDWKLFQVSRVQEAIRWIGRCGTPPILICEQDMDDGGWKDMLYHVQELTRGPRFIVASRLADDRLWCEVLNLLVMMS
jgi:hypothetical protein